ncbi:hypothetical protein OPT61_g8733 [Boeremia exigua]|uniref:Uncharacterized protein n=1 Tax=Boeremia exigua TaxID=749465 RepID=A0ACC2HX19_9PLEO|nr:hypothetical protein OPT61_g8733 [Boeremia exigua]
MPLQHPHISNKTLLKTRPQHLTRVLPRLTLINKNPVPKITRHLLNALLAETPRAEVRRQHRLDVLRILRQHELDPEHGAAPRVRVQLFEFSRDEGEEAVLFEGADLGPPEAHAEGERRLALFCREAVVLLCEAAEARARGELPVDSFRDVEAEEGEGDVG